MSYKSNEIENARIISTMLGFEDHGILTCMIQLEGNCWGCGYGGYALCGKGMYVSLEVISKILKTFDVNAWEDLKGKFIRVKWDETGTSIAAIGDLIKDKWFSFKKYFEEK